LLKNIEDDTFRQLDIAFGVSLGLFVKQKLYYKNKTVFKRILLLLLLNKVIIGMDENFKTKLNRVKTFLFDVDGVLTDGSIALLPNGEQIRTMNTKDGYAMQLAVKNGYRIAIISGGKSESVRVRLNGLGITDIYLGVSNKLDIYKEYIEIHNLNPVDILYMGDDVPDYEVMQRIGIPTCPNDSAPEIKTLCIYVSDKKGGHGCVRDVIEQVMKAQGTWEISSTIQSI